jgi:hypothetical protein
MDQPTGGKIALRQLGPLPDLDSVVFVRKQNRAFVTGQGPLATLASKGARRFMRAGTWLFLIAGVVIALIVGAMEYFERQQRAELEGSLRSVDAVVVGCDNTATSVPAFRYTAEGKTYEHYPPQTRADSCDKKPWRVTYVAGNPDAWAVAPDSPLPPFEDNIDAIGSPSAPACSCWQPSIGSSPCFRSGAPGRRRGWPRRAGCSAPSLCRLNTMPEMMAHPASGSNSR